MNGSSTKNNTITLILFGASGARSWVLAHYRISDRAGEEIANTLLNWNLRFPLTGKVDRVG